MAEDFVLSASSLNTYLRCGLSWEFAYVKAEKSPPSLRAARGTAVHAAVETNMRQKITSQVDLGLTDVLDAYSDAYELTISDGYFAKGDETTGTVKDMGVHLTSLYHVKVAPAIQPELVEEPISFVINGRTWTGQIDLAERVPTTLWGEPDARLLVRDTKTSGSKPKPEQYAVNMVGYSLGVRQMTGEREAGVVLDYLVATQKPYYEKIEGQITDEQVRAFAGLVASVSDSINRGSFPANGLTSPGVCDWCGYRNLCPAYKIKNPNP